MLDSIVDLDEYRAFCFRGEGRQNVVISAKGRRDNIRSVMSHPLNINSSFFNIGLSGDWQKSEGRDL